MFEEIKEDPQELLGVEPWLWTLCVRLWQSTDPVLRAASAGLIVNRMVPEKQGDDLVDRLNDYFESWINDFTPYELEELELAIGFEICRLQAWLSRLVRMRFPESELIAFACARELIEAASCTLAGRNCASWIAAALHRLDHAVMDAITTYGDPANEPERTLFVKRKIKLLEQARDRRNFDWWGALADIT